MHRLFVLALAAIVVVAGLTTSSSTEPDTATAGATAAGALAGSVVHLDAGHNGGNASHPDVVGRLVDAGGGVRKACDTSGAETSDGKLSEAAFSLDVALLTKARLEALGASVVMTRTTNDGIGPCITRRAAIGNEAPADAAISIHADGGPPGGRGFHVIRPGEVPGQAASMRKASDLLGRRIRTALKAKGYRPATYIGRGGLDLRTDLGGLNLSKVPKVFVELGNMRNTADARLLRSRAQRGRMADALTAALRIQLRR